MTASLQNNFVSLAGQVLVAMPGVTDPRFNRAVIFMCAHDENGAMGLVLTETHSTMRLDNMLEQLEIDFDDQALRLCPVMQGGPVETGRGFILHGPEYQRKETVIVNDQFSVTATIDGLTAIAKGEGPTIFSFFLGYAGWQAGQLEQELTGNTWLSGPATPELVFYTPTNQKWDLAMRQLGIPDPAQLTTLMGHA